MRENGRSLKMEQSKAVKVVEVIAAVWDAKPMSALKASSYAEALMSLDYPIAREAVRRVMATHEGAEHPSVADIFKAVNKITNDSRRYNEEYENGKT
jgi:hypothetical protein